MAVPWTGRVRARLAARLHVQIRLATIPAVERTPTSVPIVGHVVRVFRGGPAVRVGDEVRFPLFVGRWDDEPMPGLTPMSYESLVKATHLEAYLNGSPPACELALNECIVIDGPTLLARLRASRLEYLLALIAHRLP